MRLQLRGFIVVLGWYKLLALKFIYFGLCITIENVMLLIALVSLLPPYSYKCIHSVRNDDPYMKQVPVE